MREIRDEERGLTNEQIKGLYGLGGMIAVTGAVEMLHPHGPLKSPLPADHCRGTIDDYLLHIRHLEKLMGKNGVPIALGTDFNGFVPHSRPKYGPKGYLPESALKEAPLAFDVQGLAGPHLLPSMFEYLKRQSIGVDAFEQSAERFLQIWEKVLAYERS